MTMPESFATARLTLRAQTVDDAAVIRQLWLERYSRVPTHRRVDDDGKPSVADIAEQIRFPRTSSWRLYTVELQDAGAVVGYCGLVDNSVPGLVEPEIAFEFLQEFQGRGFATEAAATIVEWADTEKLERLWASVWDWNSASRRVLKKLGFEITDRILATGEHGNSLLTVREFPRGSGAAQSDDPVRTSSTAGHPDVS